MQAWSPRTVNTDPYAPGCYVGLLLVEKLKNFLNYYAVKEKKNTLQDCS